MTKNLIIPALMGMAALVSYCGKSEVENVYTQQDKNRISGQSPCSGRIRGDGRLS